MKQLRTGNKPPFLADSLWEMPLAPGWGNQVRTLPHHDTGSNSCSLKQKQQHGPWHGKRVKEEQTEWDKGALCLMGRGRGKKKVSLTTCPQPWLSPHSLSASGHRAFQCGTQIPVWELAGAWQEGTLHAGLKEHWKEMCRWDRYKSGGAGPGARLEEAGTDVQDESIQQYSASHEACGGQCRDGTKSTAWDQVTLSLLT